MKPFVKINIRSVLAGVLLVLLLVGIIFLMKKPGPAKVGPSKPAAEVVGYQLPSKIRGPADAPVKLVEYSDFECGSCRMAAEELQKIFLAYPGKIQLTFKHFPLTSHKWSIYAHQAAECMNAQGKFWPYQDMLYAKQQEWAPSNVPPVEILARYARELGADMNRFGACMSDVAVARGIFVEKEEGNGRQVTATPTFFLGEERFVGPREMLERGENAIRKILGLPPNPVPEKKPEPVAPAPSKGVMK